MEDRTVQMNVRISRDLKNFALAESKNQFQSLSKYIEKLIYLEKQKGTNPLKIEEVKCEVNLNIK